MASAGEVNARLAAIKNRVGVSRNRAEGAAPSMRTAEEKTKEALRLIGLAGQLLVEAATSQQAGYRMLKEGVEETSGVPGELGDVLASSVHADALVDKATRYRAAYGEVSERSEQSLVGFRDDIILASELRSNIEGRAGVLTGIVESTIALLPMATELQQNIDQCSI